MPNTNIKEAKDTVCSSTPMKYKIESVSKTEIGTVIPATDATRKGSRNIVTNITAIIAIINSCMKLVTESSTYFGSSEILATLISFGACFLECSLRLCRHLCQIPQCYCRGCISSESKMVFFTILLYVIVWLIVTTLNRGNVF